MNIVFYDKKRIFLHSIFQVAIIRLFSLIQTKFLIIFLRIYITNLNNKYFAYSVN